MSASIWKCPASTVNGLSVLSGRSVFISRISSRGVGLKRVYLPLSGPDKGKYTLFNPTPRELMREMNTDRPDKTESPFTVDAGHFQIEADILNYTYDRYNPARTRSEERRLG